MLDSQADISHTHAHTCTSDLCCCLSFSSAHMGWIFYCVHEQKRGGQQTEKVLFLTCNCSLKKKTAQGLELNRYNRNTTSQNLELKVVSEFVSFVCHLIKSAVIKSNQSIHFKKLFNVLKYKDFKSTLINIRYIKCIVPKTNSIFPFFRWSLGVI